MMICPRCGVRVAYDAKACYNCSLDLLSAEAEQKRETRSFTFGSFVILSIIALIGFFGIVEAVRYSRWHSYHDQISRLSTYESGATIASGLPVAPNDPVQGSLRNWPHNSDPYQKSDMSVDNAVSSIR